MEWKGSPPPTTSVCTLLLTRAEVMNLMRTVSTVGTKTCENGLSAGGLQGRKKLGQADEPRRAGWLLLVRLLDNGG